MSRVLLSTFLAILLTPAVVVEAQQPLKIGRIDKLDLDGRETDWHGRGLAIDLLSTPAGTLFAPEDLDVRCRLGWNEQSLFVFVAVRDSVRDVSKGDPLGRNDSIELFVSTRQGSSQRYQFTISPGDPLRSSITDRRAKKEPADLRGEAQTQTVDGGYQVEVALPWSNLSVEPVVGTVLGVQVRVNDTDNGPRKSVMWPPRGDSYTNPDSVQALALAEDSPEPVQVLARGGYDPSLARADVDITAIPALAGKEVAVREGERVLSRAVLTDRAGRAVTTLRLPFPPRGSTYPELQVVLEDKPMTTLTLGDASDARARRLMELPVAFNPSVFEGKEFPKADFETPLLAEHLIGPYQVKVTYYDKDYQLVTSAEQPGRYGAVIDIIPDYGDWKLRRFRTLYRVAKPVDYLLADPRITFMSPSAVGFDPQTLESDGAQFRGFLSDMLWTAGRRDVAMPVFVEACINPPRSGERLRQNNDAFAQDRQWWVGLKRKLNGWDQRWPRPFVGPRSIEGKPAPVLREGSPSEAGMSNDGIAKIDAICTEWAANSDQGFGVCIARHGIIVLHKAYGQRDGRPMTVTDQSWLASITKMMSGTVMMMLVDQGLVNLEDPVSKYLPAFATSAGNRPATIHDLYVHTAGLWGHWGDPMHDFDEVVGEYAPRLQVGKRHEYNGASQALGGKIVEAISGEALPLFYLRHLLEPLGMENTNVVDSAGRAYSTPLDLARFGQMFLNGGAYGGKRFLKPETVQLMMPQLLKDQLGAETSVEWGIGITYFPDEPLGPKSYGHGAASSALLRINAEHDMVVVMTRNTAGKAFGEYDPKFRQAVADAVLKETAGSR